MYFFPHERVKPGWSPRLPPRAAALYATQDSHLCCEKNIRSGLGRLATPVTHPTSQGDREPASAHTRQTYEAVQELGKVTNITAPQVWTNSTCCCGEVMVMAPCSCKAIALLARVYSVTDSGMSATSSIAICNMKAWPFTLVACLPVALRSAMFHTALHFCILRKPGEHISEEVLL